MNFLKKNANALIISLFELLIGVLLLIDPAYFTSAIIIAVGTALSIIGVIGIIKYFKANAKEAAAKQLLFKGLIALVAGAFCIFRSYWFVATFPILTIIYGIAILVTGLGKVQSAVDLLRQKKDKWFWVAIAAAVSIICAVIILSSPFTTTAVLWIFTGVSLIVEAAFDILAIILNRSKKATE